MDRITNAQQRPYCRGWIALPLRRARASFEQHKLACRAKVPDAVQVPPPREAVAFDPTCGLCGADIVADPFHHCPPAEEVYARALRQATDTTNPDAVAGAMLTLTAPPTQGVMIL